MKLKDVVKRNKFLSALGYKVRANLFRKKIQRYSKEPIKKGTILFNSFNGKGFSDNPRAIAEKMHELYPEYQLYWVYSSEESKMSLPSFVMPVQYLHDEYFEILGTANVWVFNVNIPNGTQKREGQLYIQTWHGDRGFKKFGYDALENDNYRSQKKNRVLIEKDICDYCLVGSEFGKNTFKSAFAYNGNFVEEGMPRNDCLININNQTAKEIRNKLGISDDSIIILFAPTFRDQLAENKTTSAIDINAVIKIIGDRFERDSICLLRSHSGDKLELKYTNENERIIDVSNYPDMADLLMIADILITDYSSSAGDFALTGKPIILYQDDYQDFIEDNRPLYFSMKETPYWVVHSMDELQNLIHGLDFDKSKENDKDILRFYKAFETGNASMKVCRLIDEFIKSE